MHGFCLFTSSADGHQANWAFEVASIAIPPSFGGLCHGSGVWDQGCPSPAHVRVCVPVRVQKSKKRQAPGRCLLHILIRLTSFSFLLGAQALTTSAAAAAASGSQHPSTNCPSRRSRCLAGCRPTRLFAVSRRRECAQDAVALAHGGLVSQMNGPILLADSRTKRPRCDAARSPSCSWWPEDCWEPTPGEPPCVPRTS